MWNADCIFCKILRGEEPAEFAPGWGLEEAKGWKPIVIKPLNPVTEGHMLVIPTKHVTDFISNPWVSAQTMQGAAQAASSYLKEQVQEDHPEITGVNLITSAGAGATQTVFHLHLHIVPRRQDDGLALPWSAHSPPDPT